ncbi:MAG: hypothetical protein ABIS18_05735 [Actinomycetota bacterium]
MSNLDGYGNAEKITAFCLSLVTAFLVAGKLGGSGAETVLLAAITAGGLFGLMRLVFPPNKTGASSRRARLVVTFVVSALLVAGVIIYVASLEHWGGIAIALNIIGMWAMAIALASVILFAAETVRGKKPN